MTITYIEEKADGRWAKNSKGARTYQAQFLLTTSSQTERPYHVGSHPWLPRIGSVHPDDYLAYCTDLSVDPTDPWSGWTVTASYTTEREITENPLLEPAVITWGTEQYQKPAVVDTSGNLIVNSAGDPFDPPFMMDDARPTVTFSKNVVAAPAYLLSFQDAVNTDAFTIDGVPVAAGVAKVQSVGLSEWQRREEYAYRVVTITLSFRREGWVVQPLDAGMREISGSTRRSIPNADAPVPLNGLGVAIAEPTFANAVYGNYYVYTEKAFSALPMS